MNWPARILRQLPLLPASDACLRWRDQRAYWRHRHAAGETFVPTGFEVGPISRSETADFLRQHHYLPQLPANRFRFGLLRGTEVVGVAVLGPGMPHTLRALFPDKRCKPSREPWITNRWPLRELGLTRQDCERWLWDRYGRVVPKSACVGCPFHDDAYWAAMKEQRPDEWEQACAFDEQIRFLPGIRGQCFLHRSCVPLREIDFSQTSRERRLSARGQLELFDTRDMCHL